MTIALVTIPVKSVDNSVTKSSGRSRGAAADDWTASRTFLVMTGKVDRQALRSRGTQDRIVQAALTVIALKGFGAASMDDFCLAAGCSKGGLYHHFRTKADVLRAVVARLQEADALLPPFG